MIEQLSMFPNRFLGMNIDVPVDFEPVPNIPEKYQGVMPDEGQAYKVVYQGREIGFLMITVAHSTSRNALFNHVTFEKVEDVKKVKLGDLDCLDISYQRTIDPDYGEGQTADTSTVERQVNELLNYQITGGRQ